MNPAGPVGVLRGVGLDVAEFREAAVHDGVDGAAALSLLAGIEDRCMAASGRVPGGAPLAASVVLSATSLCDDCMDLIRNCFPQMVRDRETGLAVRERLVAHALRDDVEPDEAAMSAVLARRIGVALKA